MPYRISLVLHLSRSLSLSLSLSGTGEHRSPIDGQDDVWCMTDMFPVVYARVNMCSFKPNAICDERNPTRVIPRLVVSITAVLLP